MASHICKYPIIEYPLYENCTDCGHDVTSQNYIEPDPPRLFLRGV